MHVEPEASSRDPELVIFDCDGVLVDSEAISNRVLAESLSAEGLTTTATQARSEYQGLLLADIHDRAQQKLGRELSADWLARFEAARDDAFRRELQALPGARETVLRLSAADIGVCVASQGKLAKIALTLSLAGLDDLFPESSRFSSYSVARGKPAPDVFLYAAASLDVDPACCVVVEDSPSGVFGAVAAGMRPVGFAARDEEHELQNAGAVEIVSGLDALPGLLGL